MTETKVTKAADVTPEILDMAREICDGWYPDRIEWDDVWDRLEKSTLDDGTQIFLVEDDTAAMRKIQRVIREERRNG